MASVFKDFDKPTADILNDDYGTKFTLKVKSAGPANTTLTTTTNLDTKENKLVPSVGAKWVHGSGFTLEKLEFASDLKVTVETSLVGVVPGLKLEFKGNDSDKGDILFTYTAPVATVTGEVDFHNFSSAKVSVNSGHGPFTVGGTADLAFEKSGLGPTKFGLGFGYTLPKLFFVGVRATDNFAKYSALFNYSLIKDITLAGSVGYNKKDNLSLTLGGIYKCNPNTTLKLKATTAGVLSASVKQIIDKKLTLVGAVEVPSTLKDVKFGVNATLG